MDWVKSLRYAVAFFSVMFVISYVMAWGLNFTGNPYSVSMLLASVIVLCFLSNQYGFKNQGEGVIAGLVWFAVNALLEYLVVVLIMNKGNTAYYTWSVLMCYVIVILIPALSGSRSNK